VSLARWNPFGDTDGLLGHRLRLFCQSGAALKWTSAADFSDSPGEFGIRAGLPVMKKGDVHVRLDGTVLTILGERPRPRPFHGTEARSDSFERRLRLPDEINPQAIRCDGRDGIGSTHIAKVKRQKRTRQQISVQ